MKQITFDSNGIYASDDRLRSIALECLEQERQERACRRASRAAGVQWDNWHISDRHWAVLPYCYLSSNKPDGIRFLVSSSALRWAG